MTLPDILDIFRQSIIQVCGIISLIIFFINSRYGYIFLLALIFSRMSRSMYSTSCFWSIADGDGPILGTFLDQGWFHLVIHSGIFAAQLKSQSLIDGHKFIHSTLSIQLFLFLYSTPKLFCFLYIRLLSCNRAFSTDLFVEFFKIYFGISWLYCLTLSPCLLSSLSFTSIFDLSLQFVLSDLFGVLFSSFHPNIYFRVFPSLILLLRCRLFSTCYFELIFHSGFVFLFEFLRVTLVLSQTSFAPVK